MAGDDPTRERETAGIGVVPARLRSRLAPWVDLREVGLAGLWTWLETILPILPTRETPQARPDRSGAPPVDRVRELAADLVACASDRARLTAASERYYRENQALARRVKALESTLRTVQSRGGDAGSLDDPRATEVAERYLPRGGS